MRELLAFGSVGIIATCVHYGIALLAIEGLQLGVLQANFVAYCCAVGVSFVGHSRVTFRTQMTRARFIKFVVVSVSALLLSQILLYALTQAAWFHHRINFLVIVAFIPVYSYLLNKFWVYHSKAADRDNKTVRG